MHTDGIHFLSRFFFIQQAQLLFIVKNVFIFMHFRIKQKRRQIPTKFKRTIHLKSFALVYCKNPESNSHQ